MARKTLWIAVFAAFLALALGGSVASGRIRDIFDSQHDLGSPGNPTCRQCHTPHNAEGLCLWSRAPASGEAGLESLCLSCHDGSVTDAGWYIQDPRYVNHPTDPGSEDRDCNQCHSPHEGDNWKFLRDYTQTGERMVQNANICASCHESADAPEGLTIGEISHPVNVVIDAPVDRTWDPDASPPDFAGTRLFDASGSRVVSSGPGEVKCATCHTAHGAQPGSIPFTSMDGARDIQTLSTMPYSATKYSPVCENCHE